MKEENVIPKMSYKFALEIMDLGKAILRKHEYELVITDLAGGNQC